MITIQAVVGSKFIGLDCMIHTDLKICTYRNNKPIWLPPVDPYFSFLDKETINLPSPIVPLPFKLGVADRFTYYRLSLLPNTYLNFLSIKTKKGRIVEQKFYILRTIECSVSSHKRLEGVDRVGFVIGHFEIEGGKDTTGEKAIKKPEIRVDRRKLIIEEVRK
ncbi:MAG: hypothetical protein DRI22_01030 [Caldiserica bacterium]|nr:MAG: hypothetical protein DRI22_01030 [Caldisericota bacterium]